MAIKITGTTVIDDSRNLTNITNLNGTAVADYLFQEADVDAHLNTSSAVSGNVLTWNGTDYAWAADIDFDGAFASLSAKPTTIAGYGITDAVEDFADLGVTPTTIAGYGITDAVADFADLGTTPTTLAGYGITDAVASSSISTFGGTLVDDADAAAARTTLGLGTAATSATSDFAAATHTHLKADITDFDDADYATAAQGALADSALQDITTENLGDLANVTITSAADNEVLAYDTTSGHFINQTPAEAGFATVSTSGSYNDLSDKPTIPAAYAGFTIGDGTNSETIASGDSVTIGAGSGIGVVYDTATNEFQISNTQTGFDGAFSSLTGVPTTVAGYGITDVYTETETDSAISTAIANLVSSAPATMDTLDELAAALGDDPNFATTTSTSLGNRLRIDVNNQGLTSTQQGNGRTNLGLATVAATGAYSDLTGAPTITAPAIEDVSGTPTLATGITAAEVRTAIGAGTSNFDGAYGSLTGTPTVPTNNNQLTNGAGYVTSSGVTSVDAGSGLSGGTITSTGTVSVNADQRGVITQFGQDTNDYIAVNATTIDFRLDGNLDMRLENDGDLHVDGNVVAYSTTTSDERLKKDIVKIDNAMDKVAQLNGYTFEYKHDGKKSAGIIAQEVEKVLPSAITETTLPLKTGNDEVYKTVQYDQLHGLLIEAIKELKAEIEELKKGK